ncbi:hypothetical protein [Leucobacter chironomi]|uniref:hypothetical protein n=1 Tax=Leucobacter chironomi TaxID=491918 RepID=UPI001267BF64|nr:hypothetical protein [Leucobacter chironomi]
MAAEEADEMSPQMALAHYLEHLIGVFSERQLEVLRMSEFVREREHELHDAKERAKRAISQQLTEVDEDVLDRLIALFQSVETERQDGEEGSLPSSERMDAFRVAFAEVSNELPEGIAQTYAESILNSMRPAVGVTFLYGSMLTTLVGELEVFINLIARVAFEYNPEPLTQSEKKFTWAEISAHNSIDEMRDELVDSIVKNLLRKGLPDWMSFFQDRFGLSENKAAKSLDAREAIQRRNCVVHNGSKVSQAYIDNLPDLKTKVKVDDDLKVDADYLAKAADSLFMVAYSLTWALATKALDDREALGRAIGALGDRTMFLIQEGRLDLVKQISQAAPHRELEKTPELEELSWILRINRWLAFKECGEFHKIRGEVEAFNARSKDDRYKMAKAALLDEIDEAVEFARSLLARGELKPAHILTWPLLKNVRDHTDWS